MPNLAPITTDVNASSTPRIRTQVRRCRCSGLSSANCLSPTAPSVPPPAPRCDTGSALSPDDTRGCGGVSGGSSGRGKDGEKDGEIGGSRGDMGRHPRPARTTTPPTGPSRWTSSSSTTPRSWPAPASGAALTTAPYPRVLSSAADPARPAGAVPGCTWNAAVCIPTPEGPPTLSAPAPLILPLPQPPLRPQWAAMPLQRR